MSSSPCSQSGILLRTTSSSLIGYLPYPASASIPRVQDSTYGCIYPTETSSSYSSCANWPLGPLLNVLIILGSTNPERVIVTPLCTCCPQTSLAAHPTLGQRHRCSCLSIDALFLLHRPIGPLPLLTCCTPTLQRCPFCHNHILSAGALNLCRSLFCTFPCSGFCT